MARDPQRSVLADVVRRVLLGRSDDASGRSRNAEFRFDGLFAKPGVLGLSGDVGAGDRHLDSSARDAGLRALCVLIADLSADPEATAGLLLTRFGSLANTLDASCEALTACASPAIANRILAARATHLAAETDQIGRRPLMSDPDRLDSYLRKRLAHRGKEQIRTLFLDRIGRLIADECICDGTVDESAIFPRELVRRALELDASGLVLAHNHPSLDSRPSSADIRVTHRLAEAAASLDITLVDHIIVGASNFSMRAAGLLR
tara:strand:+ start:392 stop:1177 length:786 start_codon:yes stop_codon:yes gene_type:complete